jgi:hypothetical protein
MEPEELIAKVPAKQEEPAAHDLSEMDAGELTEARHIAGELGRLHRDGAIRTQVSMRTCCATSVRPIPPGEQQGRDDPPGPRICRRNSSASEKVANVLFIDISSTGVCPMQQQSCWSLQRFVQCD